MFTNVIKRSWWKYALELVIALVLISLNLNLFLVYAYLMLVLKIDLSTDYLRRLSRAFQVSNDVKLMEIAKELKITQEDLDKALEANLATLSKKDRESLEDDFKGL